MTKAPEPVEPTPEQQDIIKALDSLLTERVPAHPAPQGITKSQPLEPPCIEQHRSRPL